MFKITTKIEIFFFISIAISVLIYFYYIPLNENSIWMISQSIDILQHKSITDFFNTSLPPILLAIPSSFIALHYSLSPLHIFVVLVVVLGYLSFFLTRQILSLSRDTIPQQVRQLSLIILFMFFIFPGYDFGDREHIFILLSFPYILSVMLHEHLTLSRKQRIAIGLLAAIGFSMKPYFYLIFLTSELSLIIYYKSIRYNWREEFFIIAFSGFTLLSIILYGGAHNPLSLDMALALYPFFAKIPSWKLFAYNNGIYFASLLFAYILLNYRRSLFFLAWSFSLTSILFLYIYQAKGYSYHLLPLYMLGVFGFFYTLIVEKVQSEYLKNFIIILLIGVTIRHKIPFFDHLKYRDINFSHIVDTLPNNSSIFVVAPDMYYPAYIMWHNHKTWSSRFPSIWMFGLSDKQEIKKYENMVLRAIEEDIEYYFPNYIIFPLHYSYHYEKLFLHKDERIAKLLNRSYKRIIKNHHFIVLKAIKKKALK